MQVDKYAAQIAAAATKHNIDPDVLRALAQHESVGNPFAVGDGGKALGLTQIHRAAAYEGGVDWDKLHAAVIAGDEATAVAIALDGGAGYLAKMLAQFKDRHVSLLAYNQGPTSARAALAGEAYATAVEALIASAPAAG